MMKENTLHGWLAALLLAPCLAGCGATVFYQADDASQESRVWNLPYNDTDDTGGGAKRGVFMYYIDGKPISFTRPGAVLAPGQHRFEVQCYVCDDHLGYAIDRHVIDMDLEAGRDYRFGTRPVGVDRCDAWLAEEVAEQGAQDAVP